MTVHIIWCRGCLQAWTEVEMDGPGGIPMRVCSHCPCTCADPADPLYEAWVSDPDPAGLPAGEWAGAAAWAMRDWQPEDRAEIPLPPGSAGPPVTGDPA
jgi:hypothetical protein